MTDNRDVRRRIRKLNIVGIVIVVVLVFGVGGWASTAQLAGAVIAPGQVVVSSNVRKVQHPTGGIVGEIFVKQGDKVEVGQVLLVLDDTVPRATLRILRNQLHELLVRQARLFAERDGADEVVIPDELAEHAEDKAIATTIAGEQKLFLARRNTRTGQRSQLNERIQQIEEEVRGLTEQRTAKEREIEFISEELTGVEELWKKNLVGIARVMHLRRDRAKLQGDHGQLGAEIARAHGRISEIRLQIIQVDQDFRTEVLRDLREADAKIVEVRERIVPAQDQLNRIDMRSPESGIVHQLNIHTKGGVIAQGETVMLIVPFKDELIIEAKVAPSDIDQVKEGSMVQVRITAGNQRTTPTVTGVVTTISADQTRDPPSGVQPGIPYFQIRVMLTSDSMKQLGDLRLLPGMQAEVFIETDPRTPLEYLVKPLFEQIARTFRER